MWKRVPDGGRVRYARVHALGRGMRGQAAGSSEEAECGNFPQNLVRDNGGRLLDFLAADDVGARRHIAELLLSSCDRHNDLILQPAQLHVDVNRCRGLRPQIRADGLRREAIRLHAYIVKACRQSFDTEFIGGDRGLSSVPLFFCDGNSSAGDRKALRIHDLSVDRPIVGGLRLYR